MLLEKKWDPVISDIDYNFFQCEDFNNVIFLFNQTIGFQRCTWLKENLNNNNSDALSLRNEFCTTEHLAYYFCEETCEKCIPNNCEDDNNTTFEYLGNQYDCEWLSSKSYILNTLCHDRNDVKDICPSTCRVCT